MDHNLLHTLQGTNCRLGLHRWNNGACEFCGLLRTTPSLRKLKRIALDFRDPDAFLTAVKRLAGFKSTRSESWGLFEMKKGKHTVTVRIGRDLSSRYDVIYNLVYENKPKQIRFVLVENGSFTYS
jgi:hypothetical protein